MEAKKTVEPDLVQLALSFTDSMGWSISDIFAQANLDPALVTGDRIDISEEQIAQVVRTMWRRTNDEMFGLGSHPLPRGSFRLICYALLGAADLEDALHRFGGFLRALPALPLTIEIAKDSTAISLRTSGNGDSAIPTFSGLIAIHRLLCWLVKYDIEPEAVEFEAPASSSFRALDSAFGTLPHYGARQTRIVLANRLLHLPIMRDERDIDQLISESPMVLIRRTHYLESTAGRVKVLLSTAVQSGELVSAIEIARRLAVSAQTLRRRLAEDGTSVRAISADVRHAAAVESLQRGDEPIAELSERLGYSEQSAFVRAFVSWTGVSPAAFRRARRT